MRIQLQFAAALFVMSSAAAPPDTAKTNILGAIRLEKMPDMGIVEYTGPQRGFWNEYRREIDQHAVDIVKPQIGEPAGFRLSIQQLHEGYGWRETRAHIAGRAIGRVFSDEFRDTLALRLPTQEWADRVTGLLPHWIADFIDNSIGNSQEERRDLSLFSSEESIIWKYEHGWVPRVGYRPFRGDPYGYIESNLGRQSGGFPIVCINGRYYTNLDPTRKDFGKTKVEVNMTFPVDHVCQFTLGLSGYPYEHTAHDQKWTRIFQLDIPLKLGIVSAGAHVSDGRQLYFTQWSCSF